MIVLQNEYIRAEISERGAELNSLKRVEDPDTQFIWQGDPKFWAARSPILFPIVGSLKNGAYYYDGYKYELAIHGFASSEMFKVESHSADEAVFVLNSTPRTLDCYPFEFSLRLRYSLTGTTLHFHYTVDNIGDKEMYFSLGAHPGFSLHSPFHQYYLMFDQPETIYPYRTFNKLVMEAPDDCLLANSRRLNLDYSMFVKGAYVCKNVRSSKLLLCSDDQANAVEVGWDGFKALGIWTKPDAPFVCIEPWTGHGDTESCSGHIQEKPMITRLARGERFSAKLYIAIKESSDWNATAAVEIDRLAILKAEASKKLHG